MTIKFKCSTCQAPLLAPDEAAGRKAKCRQCGGAVQVPNPEADRWPPGMAPASVSRPAQTKSKAQPPRPAPPAAAPAVPTAQVVSPQAQAAPAGGSQPAVQVAIAVPVTPIKSPQKQKPPPLAVPVAAPLDEFTPPPTAAPVEKDSGENDSGEKDSGENDSGPSPLDEIAAMLDFEKTVPRAPSPDSLDINPYRSPTSTDGTPKSARDDASEFKRITYGETIHAAWEILKANFWRLVGATALYSISMTFAQGVLTQALEKFGQAVAARGAGSTGLAIVVITLYLLTLLAFVAFFTLGYLKYIVQITRGKPAEVSMIFSSLPLFLPGYLLFVAIVLAVMIGVVLLIVPGLLAGLLFALAPIVFVDRESGVVESLRVSAGVMSKNLLPAFLLLFSVGMAGNILLVLTCGLGSLVVTPFHAILASVIYLRASGRRTAVD